jgi:hypothetical protein
MEENEKINLNKIIGSNWPLSQWIERQLHPERYSDVGIRCKKTKFHLTKREEVTFDVEPLFIPKAQTSYSVKVFVMRVEKSSKTSKLSSPTWHLAKNQAESVWSSRKCSFTWRFESEDWKDAKGCLFVFYKESGTYFELFVSMCV